MIYRGAHARGLTSGAAEAHGHVPVFRGRRVHVCISVVLVLTVCHLKGPAMGPATISSSLRTYCFRFSNQVTESAIIV